MPNVALNNPTYSDDAKPEAMIPEGMEPIEFLNPKSRAHAFVLNYLKRRLEFSERKMQPFHPRWRMNEYMMQAYMTEKDFDKLERSARERGEAPSIDDSPVAINVPFAWSTVNTIVTYLLHMFAGRRPIFQVGTYRAEQVNSAMRMETFLQYNADVVKFVRALYFFLMDGETYGLAVLRTLWKRELKTRTMLTPPDQNIIQVAAAQGLTPQPTSQQQEYVAFEGSSCANVDPFMFFPDPRVPMHEVAEKGEWVFWRAFMGRNSLLKEQQLGRLKYIDQIDPAELPMNDWSQNESARGVRAMGTMAWDNNDRDSRVAPNLQVDQGTIEIIPKELGLGTSEYPEKWMFTMVNKRWIVQAMKVDLPTGRHPIVVAEPNSVGYSFGQLGTVDMLSDMQQIMSWFMNSHIFNVRAALNNMFVVDPTKVYMEDFKSPKPGKIIRLKQTAFGLADAKTAVSQLQVADVTRSHLNDFQMFGRLAADLTGATDNVRGLQDAGGRKTATEIRTSAEAGTSRLAAKGTVYSTMAFTSLAETWAMNAQNFLSEEFELNVLGQEQEPQSSFRISQQALQGDFVYPVHDGTLPIDKLAMLEVWKEIYLAILQDPQLRSSYNILEMFDWIAQLGGAQNIKSFRMQMVPQTQQMQSLQPGGGGVPMEQAIRAITANAA